MAADGLRPENTAQLGAVTAPVRFDERIVNMVRVFALSVCTVTHTVPKWCHLPSAVCWHRAAGGEPKAASAARTVYADAQTHGLAGSTLVTGR